MTRDSPLVILTAAGRCQNTEDERSDDDPEDDVTIPRPLVAGKTNDQPDDAGQETESEKDLLEESTVQDEKRSLPHGNGRRRCICRRYEIQREK
ncbi:hypothetical protein [Halorubrum sp. AS12]|uniref:hypothetical protein n=1 Tax=Halorubrum sp. AS12 TaxID=3409687 RepID=UPI003DA6E56E